MPQQRGSSSPRSPESLSVAAEVNTCSYITLKNTFIYDYSYRYIFSKSGV